VFRTLSDTLHGLHTAHVAAGHPDQQVLNKLLAAGDVFLPNICSLERAYGASVIVDADIVIHSTDGGSTFRISGTNKVYTSKGNKRISGAPRPPFRSPKPTVH